MKKVFKLGLLLLAAIAMASCQPTEDFTGSESQLIGRWQNENNKGWYRVFYNDIVSQEDDSTNVTYKWGKEWHENEGVYEDDLTLHGNGWFKWRKTGKDLFEIHYMEYDWAKIPQSNTISLLTDERLEYTEQDGRKRVFNKVVQVKN